METEVENVQVVVRIRPMQANEKKNGDIPCVRSLSNGKEVQVKVGPLEAQTYRCNKCFSPDATQDSFFEECRITDLIDSTVEGYKACVFAFGQTGAGKTYTMIGGSKGLTHQDKHVGLIVRSLSYLFKKLDHFDMKYRIKLSCLEIYQEHVYDLFTEEKERIALNMREHQTEGFFLEGLKYVECKDFSLACSVLDMAVKNRQTGGHDLNKRSSRSHCITEIYLELKNPNEENDERSDANNFEYSHLRAFSDSRKQSGHLVRGKISLVDLAGSERLKHTNSTGKVLQEAGFINRSLYVLGKVIAGLVRTEGDLNHKDVPYRDSKLTKLLISSLGGSSRTLLIACVSEAKGSQAETLRTLKFSMSCARIRNKPVKFLDPQEKLILDLKQEIKRLKNENKKLRSNILTAPASNGRVRQSIFSDEEDPSTASPVKHRALSANQQRVLGGRKKAQQKNLSSLFRKDRTGKRLKSTQSELLAKYPQLNKILLAEQRGNKSHDNLEPARLRPKYKSIAEDVHEILRPSEEASSVSPEESRRRISQDLLDEMVHRRASGPLIFKDKSSPILSVRSSWQYQPADNYTKHLDQQASEFLSPGRLRNERSNAEVAESRNLHEIKKEVANGNPRRKSQRKAQSQAQKPLKPSPYIAHLAKKKKKKANNAKEGNVAIQSSSSNNNVERFPAIAAQPSSKASSDLHDSIEKAFAEFGVGLAPTASVDKLPKIDSSPKKGVVPSKRPEAKKEKENLPALPNNQKKEVDELDLSGGVLEVLRTNFDQKRNISSAPLQPKETKETKETAEPVSTPERLRKKLITLEESLKLQRTDMEDNPGHVTDAMEEKYRSLQREVKLLKVEISALTGEVFEDSPVKAKAKAPVAGETAKTEEEEEEEYGDDYENFDEEDFAAEEESGDEKEEAPIVEQPVEEKNSENEKKEEEKERDGQREASEEEEQQKQRDSSPLPQTQSPVSRSEAPPPSVSAVKESNLDKVQTNQSDSQANNEENYENDDDGYGDEEFDDFED